MREITVWYWFSCPECESTWGSENCSPESEWCHCNSVETPEFIYEEQVQL